MRFFNRRIHKAVSAFDTVEISEQKGVRFLHLSNSTVQSAMRISAPHDLELSYTQAMLGFLLFNNPPGNALMIGLGGGSLAKFLYHHFEQMQLTAVEINPEVIKAAYHFFNLPADPQRLQVIQADAVEYIVGQHGWDCILLDGFDAAYQVAGLASEDFYQQCANALSSNGILSVNLWGNDPNFELYRQRIAIAFEQRILCLPAARRGNIIVFAFAAQPLFRNWKILRQRARQMEKTLNLPFTDFAEQLKTTANWLAQD